MTLHIFNPEHDIALASGLENFTAPHAGRQLRHDLGFLPALWATDGDCVLVDDAELAKTSMQKLAVAARKHLGARAFDNFSIDFLQPGARRVADCDSVEPWGWDAALCARLRRMGVGDALLPGDEQLREIREWSHRRTSIWLLKHLLDDGVATAISQCPLNDESLGGKSYSIMQPFDQRPLPEEFSSVDEAWSTLACRFRGGVVKAPWSSSGRGVRFFVKNDDKTEANVKAWARGVIARQGSVVVEPYYKKVKDFGMEFEARADGKVYYQGLSLFQTANGAYTGNIVATERRKWEMMSRYFPAEQLYSVKEHICHHLTTLLQGRYQGPLGVDMMVVYAEGGFLLHPCVEVNLRRTMGHVALALAPVDDDLMGVMRITYADGCYKMGIEALKGVKGE